MKEGTHRTQRMLRTFTTLLLLIVSQVVSAATFTWVGMDGDWTDTSNWNSDSCTGCYPVEGSDIADIPGPFRITVNTEISIGELILGGGQSLAGQGSLEAAATLLTGDIQIDLPFPDFKGGDIVAEGVTTVTGAGTMNGISFTCLVDRDENACDLTAIDVVIPSFVLNGTGRLLLHTDVADHARTLYSDVDIGIAGQGGGDIYFIGPPAMFSLVSIVIEERFSSIFFAESDVTLQEGRIDGFFEEGLRDMNSLSITGEVTITSGTLETRVGTTVEEGGLLIVDGDIYLGGPLDVAGTLRWDTNSITTNTFSAEPDYADGPITIRSGATFDARPDNRFGAPRFSGNGWLSVHGLLRAEHRNRPFNGSIPFEPDSLYIDGVIDIVSGGSAIRMGNGVTDAADVMPLRLADATVTIGDGSAFEIGADTDYFLDEETVIAGLGTFRIEGPGIVNDTTYVSNATIGTRILHADGALATADLTSGTVSVERIEATSGTLLLPADATTDMLVVGFGADVVYADGGTALAFAEVDAKGTVDFGGQEVTVLDSLAFGQTLTTRVFGFPTLTVQEGARGVSFHSGTLEADSISIETGVPSVLTGTLTVPGVLVNRGTFRQPGGDLRADGRVLNRGAYVFESASVLDEIIGSGVFENEGRFERTGAEGGIVEATFVNRDSVVIRDGRLAFGAPLFSTNLTNEGVILGTGTLGLPSVVDVGGTLSPGDTVGMLAVPNDLTLVSGSVLEVDLGGYEAGTEHDLLAVTGTVTLSGAVRVELARGFVPVVGDRFAVVTCTVTCGGTIESVELPEGLEATVEVLSDRVEVFVTGISVSSEPEVSEAHPTVLALAQPYPNPARDLSTVGFDLPEATDVRLVLHDALGREVAVLKEGPHPAGRYTATFSLGSLAPGLYFARLTVPSGVRVRQVTVVR